MKMSWDLSRSARPAMLAALILFSLSTSTYAAPSFGNCKVLFVGQKAPVSPGPAITPLCAEDTDAVFFATGYSKQDNHGAWSAYRLDEEQVAQMIDDPLPRPSARFKQIPKLNVKGYTQPRHDSYTGTGWDRGHLAPNGAMAWDVNAQKSSFSVANIAPQDPAMNRNIWRCFEVSIREWAADSGDTYVVVGTIGSQGWISSDRDPYEVEISAPSHFLAMVYRKKPVPMAIGVMVPNEAGHRDIREYMMSVDELEQRSGFNFRLPSQVAKTIPNLAQWPTRLVTTELLGKLPPIDQQCPRVQ